MNVVVPQSLSHSVIQSLNHSLTQSLAFLCLPHIIQNKTVIELSLSNKNISMLNTFTFDAGSVCHSLGQSVTDATFLTRIDLCTENFLTYIIYFYMSLFP